MKQLLGIALIGFAVYRYYQNTGGGFNLPGIPTPGNGLPQVASESNAGNTVSGFKNIIVQ